LLPVSPAGGGIKGRGFKQKAPPWLIKPDCNEKPQFFIGLEMKSRAEKSKELLSEHFQIEFIFYFTIFEFIKTKSGNRHFGEFIT